MSTFSDLLHGRNAGDIQYWDGSWHAPSPRDYHATYNWRFTKTGEEGMKTAIFPSRRKFLEELANWNRSPSWKYWES